MTRVTQRGFDILSIIYFSVPRPIKLLNANVCGSSKQLLVATLATKSHQNQIDRSKVPKLNEFDLEEKTVSGSGPGGQSVNKAVNCCQLKHKPTGLLVKVHHTRSLEENKKIARELLVTRLDNFYNGEDSVENQKKRLALKKIAARQAQQERRRTLKENWQTNNTRDSKTSIGDNSNDANATEL